MTVATSSRSALAAADDDRALDRHLAEGRRYSAEFPGCFANHLPMVLVALRRLGGSDERLEEFFVTYRDAHSLPLLKQPASPIASGDWAMALGDRSREADYQAFFANEVRRLGGPAAIAAYLPSLLPGLAASATHAVMRLAYGVLRGDEAEQAVALGYWAATYLPLGAATSERPITDDPADVLLRLRSIDAFRAVDTNLELLWHFMRAMAATPEFAPVVNWLKIGPDTLPRVAAASLALYAGTLDFCALHALTGTHWIRLIGPYAGDRDRLLRYFWQAIAALYPLIGFPDLPDASLLEEWRHVTCPDWPDIAATAARSNDEHDLSLSFSAWEEWKVYGDPLYKVVAARRLAMIP